MRTEPRAFPSLILVVASMCLHCGDDERTAGAPSSSGGAGGSGTGGAGGSGTGGGSGGTAVGGGGGVGPADAGDASSGGSSPDGGPTLDASAGGAPGAGGAAGGSTGAGGNPGDGGESGSGGDDGGPPPPPDECDIATQTGCDPGERCVFRTDLERTSCEPTGTVPVGELCSDAPDAGASACVAEAVCVGGRCIELCTFPDTCGPGTNCVALPGLESTGICVPSCDPFSGTGCEPPLGCYATPGSASTACQSAGRGATGVRCSDNTACQGEHGCVAGDGTTTTRCRRHCDTSSPDSGALACAGRCVPFEEIYGAAGPDRLGFCVPD